MAKFLKGSDHTFQIPFVAVLTNMHRSSTPMFLRQGFLPNQQAAYQQHYVQNTSTLFREHNQRNQRLLRG